MFSLMLALIVIVIFWRLVGNRLNKSQAGLEALQTRIEALDQVGVAVAGLRREVDTLRAELRAGGAEPSDTVRLKPDTTEEGAAFHPAVRLRPDTTEQVRSSDPAVRLKTDTTEEMPASPEAVQPTAAPRAHPLTRSAGSPTAEAAGGAVERADTTKGLETPARTVPAAMPRASDMAYESLETRIGSQWLLYVGVVAIVVGASYFVKLAFDSQWITETTRVVIGGIAGVLLTYAGTRFVRAGYPLYGQMMSGGGIAVLYVSLYAASNFYQLIGRPAAFALMSAVTMAAAWLADRQRSQGLALMAVGGGFATPFLLDSGTDTQIALFSYDALLVAGTMYLAHRREWPALNLVSYAGTTVTLLAWADRFYTQDKFLITELFLTAFCGMFLYILHQNRRSSEPLARLVQRVLWSAPLWYYLASLTILYDHSVPLLVFLIALALIGMIASRRLESSLVRLLFWCAVELPLLVWVADHAGPTWLTAGLAIVTGVYALTLIAQLEVILRKGRRLDGLDVGLLHLNGLVAYGGAYMLIDEVRSAATAVVAAAFALWHIAVAAWLAKRDRQDAIHLAALAFTLAAIAVALRFDGAWVIVAWAAEGAAIIWLGLRERRGWLRAGGALLLAMAVVLLSDLLFSSPPIGQLVLLNRRAASAAFVVSLLYGLARLYRRSPQSADGELPSRALLLVAANAVTLLLLTSEIQAFWELRDVGQISRVLARTGRLAREVMLSITWAAYATAVVVAGLRKRCAPIRYFAIVVFGITILKVFMVDLAQLDRFYRVLSIVGLGVLLLLTSYLYQRFRSRLAPQGEGA